MRKNTNSGSQVPLSKLGNPTPFLDAGEKQSILTAFPDCCAIHWLPFQALWCLPLGLQPMSSPLSGPLVVACSRPEFQKV